MHGIWVTSYKDGLLSRVAHDVHMRVDDYTVARDGDVLTVLCELTSIIVEGPLYKGRCDPKRFSAKDRKDILSNVHNKVLHTQRHPQATFTGTLGQRGLLWTCDGSLSLHGRRFPLAVEARVKGGVLTGSVTLAPSNWGIPPFKALLGAIKLQDRVEVSFRLPWQAEGLG